MAKMAATCKAIMSALMLVDFSRVRSPQNTSQGSGHVTTSHGGPQSVADPSSIQRNKKRPNSAIESIQTMSQVQ